MKFKLITCAVIFSTFSACNLLAQAAGSGGDASVKTKETLWTLIVKGGPIMIPIGICSLVALALFFERLIGLSRTHIIPKQFATELTDMLNKKTDPLKIFEYAEDGKSIIAQIIKAGALKWKLNRSVVEVEKNVEDAAFREVGKMRRSLRGLKIIANVAPMLGLLGTIVGMITAFQTVALSTATSGKSAELANGIYEAMVTTAAGLIIAIPVLFLYYFLLKKVDDYTDEIQIVCNDFLDEVVHQHKEG